MWQKARIKLLLTRDVSKMERSLIEILNAILVKGVLVESERHTARM